MGIEGSMKWACVVYMGIDVDIVMWREPLCVCVCVDMEGEKNLCRCGVQIWSTERYAGIWICALGKIYVWSVYVVMEECAYM